MQMWNFENYTVYAVNEDYLNSEEVFNNEKIVKVVAIKTIIVLLMPLLIQKGKYSMPFQRL